MTAPKEPFSYDSRTEFVTEVLVLFNEARKDIIAYYTSSSRENEPDEVYSFQGTQPCDAWSAEWDPEQGRITKLYMHESMVLPNGMKSGIRMEIDIPSELGGDEE